jgi:hypothetical protein
VIRDDSHCVNGDVCGFGFDDGLYVRCHREGHQAAEGNKRDVTHSKARPEGGVTIMDIEPRHVFFFIFLSVTLTLMAGVADGVLQQNGGVTDTLINGGLVDKLYAFGKLCVFDLPWLNQWVAWPLRLINLIFGMLFIRFLWKLVPIVGR